MLSSTAIQSRPESARNRVNYYSCSKVTPGLYRGFTYAKFRLFEVRDGDLLGT